MTEEQEKERLRFISRQSLSPSRDEFLAQLHKSILDGEQGAYEFLGHRENFNRASNHDWENCQVRGCSRIYAIWKSLL